MPPKPMNSTQRYLPSVTPIRSRLIMPDIICCFARLDQLEIVWMRWSRMQQTVILAISVDLFECAILCYYSRRNPIIQHTRLRRPNVGPLDTLVLLFQDAQRRRPWREHATRAVGDVR